MAYNFRFSEIAFWSILDASDFSFLSLRELGICDEGVAWRRILDSQRMTFGCFGCFFLSLRELRISDEGVVCLRILDSQRLTFAESWMLLTSLSYFRENRESVNRGRLSKPPMPYAKNLTICKFSR